MGEEALEVGGAVRRLANPRMVLVKIKNQHLRADAKVSMR